MKKIFIFLFFLPLQNIKAQEFNFSKTDSTIFNAMRDEMNRSMKEYKNLDAGQFFYIMYQIDDGKRLSASAMLGSIIKSEKKDFRSQGYRIMLGDYNFNDENFISSSIDYDFPMITGIEVPLGDDYIGIRRALWNYTEIAFKNCTETYLDKKEYFKENPQKKPTIPDYTKVDSIKFLKNSNINFLDQKLAEDFVRKISMVFRSYDEITKSTVSFNQIRINVYLLSTEGVMCKIPLDYSQVTVNASISNDTTDEQSINENISFYEKDPNNFLINSDKIKNSSQKFAEYLISIKNAEEMKDDYDGPVIFSDLASSNFFYNTLFGYENNLIANRESVLDQPKFTSMHQPKSTLEDKIGKKVIPSDFTIIDKPKLEKYDNKTLLGVTYIDQEGVVPPDELTLIQNGELITLLSNRTPSSSASRSNGHKRLGVSGNGSLSMMAPSNLFVNYSNGKEKNVIISKLIEICKENSLEYGIEITSLDSTADESPYVYYKIDLNGNKKMIKPMSFPEVDFKALNKVKDCSSKKYISNILNNDKTSYFSIEMGGTKGLIGCFKSLIVPSSILLKEIDILNSKDLKLYSPID